MTTTTPAGNDDIAAPLTTAGPPVAGSAADSPPAARTRSAAGAGRDDAMTRSEEQLRVGVVRHATERIRVRKVLVTEEVTQTVTVRREELRVERESLAGAGPGSAADINAQNTDAGDLEIVLYAERPVVTTQVVPVERIRVRRERITDQVTIAENLRREEIDATVEMNDDAPGISHDAQKRPSSLA